MLEVVECKNIKKKGKKESYRERRWRYHEKHNSSFVLYKSNPSIYKDDVYDVSLL